MDSQQSAHVGVFGAAHLRQDGRHLCWQLHLHPDPLSPRLPPGLSLPPSSSLFSLISLISFSPLSSRSPPSSSLFSRLYLFSPLLFSSLPFPSLSPVLFHSFSLGPPSFPRSLLSLFPLLHSSLHSSLNLFLYWSHISSLILRLSVFGHV